MVPGRKLPDCSSDSKALAMIGMGIVLAVIALTLLIGHLIPKGEDWNNPDC